MKKTVAKKAAKPVAAKKPVKMAKGGAVKAPKKLAFGGLNDVNMPSRTPVAPVAPKPVLSQEQAAAQQAKRAAAQANIQQRRLEIQQRNADRRAARRTGMQIAPRPTATPQPVAKSPSLSEAQMEAMGKAKQVPQQTASPTGPAGLGQPQTATRSAIEPTQEQNLQLQKAYKEAQQAKQTPADIGTSAATQQAQQAPDLQNLSLSEEQKGAMKSYAQAKLAPRPTSPADIGTSSETQQAKDLPTAPPMAKGGLVKKKSSMKGIINKFIR